MLVFFYKLLFCIFFCIFTLIHSLSVTLINPRVSIINLMLQQNTHHKKACDLNNLYCPIKISIEYEQTNMWMLRKWTDTSTVDFTNSHKSLSGCKHLNSQNHYLCSVEAIKSLPVLIICATFS